MANLYELMGDFAFLNEMMSDEGTTADRADEILGLLDDAKSTLAQKVDNTARVLGTIEASIDTFKAEERRLAARRKTLENSRERLRDWVRSTMLAHSVDKLATDIHSVSVAEGKEKVVVVDQTKVPDEYVVTERKVSKTLVMSTYKDSGEIPAGCDIVRGEPSLRIR